MEIKYDKCTNRQSHCGPFENSQKNECEGEGGGGREKKKPIMKLDKWQCSFEFNHSFDIYFNGRMQFLYVSFV